MEEILAGDGDICSIEQRGDTIEEDEDTATISFIEVKRGIGSVRYRISFEDKDEISEVSLQGLLLMSNLITPDTLWYDKEAISVLRNGTMHPLTREVLVYIQNDYEKLRDIVWFNLEQAKKVGIEEINFRKQHICDVVSIANKLYKKYCKHKLSLQPIDIQQVETMMENGLEWAISLSAYLHDMYKLRSSSMDHGGLAASYFTQNICVINDPFVKKIDEAIRYHSYPEMNLNNIIYKIIVDADILSKYTLSYVEHKKTGKKVSLEKMGRKVIKRLDRHVGCTPFYQTLRMEYLDNLISDIKEKGEVNGK